MRNLDGKYSVKDNEIIKTATGEPIPHDEPLFIFRARDNQSLRTLQDYYNNCYMEGCTEFHMKGILDAIQRFESFKKEHPERMKQPGITLGK